MSDAPQADVLSRRRKKRVRATVRLLVSLLAFSLVAGCSRAVGAVTGLRLTPEGSSVLVSWDPVPNATGYYVYFDTSPDVSSSTHTVSAQTQSVTDTIGNLSVGTTYYCVVIAYGAFGFAVGPPSDVASIYLGGSSPGTTQNALPVIEAISAYPGSTPGQVLLAATADDSDGDTLTYSWSVDGTALSTSSSQVVWQGISGSGAHTASVTVSDGTTSVTQSVGFTI